MKKLIKEFGNSIYNPSFYEQINHKSLKSIFGYIFRVDSVITIVALIVVSIYYALNLSSFGDVSNSALVAGFIISIVSTPLVIFLTIFITWIIYSWIFGVIILGISTLFKSKIPYTVSVKTAMYAMSLGVVLNIIPYLPYKS